jgi:hypothetical protein
MEHPPKLKLSLRLFILNLIGVVLMAVGMYSVASGNVLGWPAGAGMMMTGMALVALFLVDVFKRIGALQQGLRQQDGNQG